MLVKISSDAHCQGRHNSGVGRGATNAERANLSLRMTSCPLTRLTNPFIKKMENHAHLRVIHTVHYEFVRLHRRLRCLPAMAVDVSMTLWELADTMRVSKESEKAARDA